MNVFSDKTELFFQGRTIIRMLILSLVCTFQESVAFCLNLINDKCRKQNINKIMMCTQTSVIHHDLALTNTMTKEQFGDAFTMQLQRAKYD